MKHLLFGGTSPATVSVAVILLSLFPGCSAQVASDSGEGREKLSENFPVLDPKDNLFSLDGFYILRATFRSSHRLSAIEVIPKYFLGDTHPEWIEPDAPVFMSKLKYEELLARIDKAMLMGNLVKRGRLGISTNLRTIFRDEYDRAIVARAMFRTSPEEEDGVAWFKVFYLHEVKGKLESKKRLEDMKLDEQFRIKVDGEWYWTTKDVFQPLIEGDQVMVSAAGPIDIFGY